MFFVKDNYGNRHLMSAKRLHEYVTTNEIGKGIEWKLNAKNIIKVCKKNSFNKDFAKDIEISLMDYYGMLLFSNDPILLDNKSNLKAVCNLFNSTSKIKDECMKKSRSDFLLNYLNYITTSKKMPEYKKDANFNKARQTWVNKTFNELINEEYIDFYNLYNTLMKKFNSIISFLIDSDIIVSSNVNNKESVKPHDVSLNDNNVKKRILSK